MKGIVSSYSEVSSHSTPDVLNVKQLAIPSIGSIMKKHTNLYLKIAGFTIQVCLFNTTHPARRMDFLSHFDKHYGGFKFKSETFKKTDFTVDVKENFENEPNILAYEKKQENKIVVFYGIPCQRFQAILRDIVQRLLCHNEGFIFHAAASNFCGKALLFSGRSGAGKSTASQLIIPYYPLLSDDLIILKFEKGKYMVYQTPILEKNAVQIKNSNGYHLDKVFFLRKSYIFKLEHIVDKLYILKMLVSQLWTDVQNRKTQLKSVMEFAKKFDRFYFLYFDKKAEDLKIILGG